MAKQFGRTTPPAIFPVILGTLGLGMAWRNAAQFMGVADWLGEIILGAGVALFLVGFAAYLTKLARRPSCLTEDLRTIPGRGGLSAMGMSMMLAGGALWPYMPDIGYAVLVISLAMHVFVSAVMVFVLKPLPLEARQMTPIWHLAFVGPIVAAMVMLPMGMPGLAEVIFVVSLLVAVTIWTGSAVMYLRAGFPPAPLRPIMAIHLGPSALLGMVSAGLGFSGIATAFLVVSFVILGALLGRVFWLTEAGFSPFWGAFTFPLAAFASQIVIMSVWYPELVWVAIGAMALATLAVPPIAAQVCRMWIKGSLATKSNAARA